METPQIICYSRGDKIPIGYTKVNTTSRSGEEWSKRFSPFYLGPCAVRIDGKLTAVKIFENAWQYSKHYKKHTVQEFNKWSQDGFKKEKASRFPMGRGAKPMYALHNEEKLNYVEARFKIYAPLYEKCINKYCIDSLNRLKTMYENGEKIALFDFDGHGYHLGNLKLEDVIYNTRRKMGHSFVLIGMITGNRFWDAKYDAKKVFEKSVPRYTG